MLRRPPTVITLTADDIAAYEQARQQRLWAAQNNSQMSDMSHENVREGKNRADPNDELQPLARDKARVRTKEERIMGVAASSPAIEISDALQERQSTSAYWIANIKRQGTIAYGEGSPFAANITKGWKLHRNVKDYGAKGDGVTDDTDAINAAIADGGRCGDGCHSSTVVPAMVYFPPGTYMVKAPIIMYYYTQMIGDIFNMPTIKATADFFGIGLIDSDVYYPGGANWYQNQNNFYRQIRNFILDIKNMPMNFGHCLHWQVAQATSLQNIVFNMVEGGGEANGQYGIFMDNGSGGWMSDLVFNGGGIGAFLGNQQFTARNLTFNNCVTAVYMNWDWLWAFKSLTVNNCQIGIDISQGGGTVQTVGSLLVQDSYFNHVDQAIVTTWSSNSTPVAGGTMVLDNVDFTTSNYAVSYPNKTIVVPGGQKVQSFIQGRAYTAFEAAKQFGNLTCYVPQATSGRIQRIVDPPPKPSVLLTTTGTIYERSKPQYENVPLASFISAKDNGCKGDGVTDDTAAIQALFNKVTRDQVVYFDHGAYVVSNTIQVPTHIRMTGEMWPLIMVNGASPTFSDVNNPKPAFRVGNPGDVGAVEMTDMVFETRGPAPGAIIVEWNLAGETQGAAAMWDTHWRIGGTMGTGLQSDHCTKTPSVATPADPACVGAFLLMHITTQASIYMENNWGWVADHELDLPNENQINLYNARGILIESRKGVWVYGSSFEHSVFYNYQIANAKNVYMSIIQSETAYMQDNPNAINSLFPIDSRYSDPSFASCYQPICYKTWSLRIYNSTYVLNYGAGLYSFFNNYDQGCLVTQACQENIVSVELSEGIYLYGLSTEASTNMVTVDNTALVPQSANLDTFCETVAVFEYP